MGRIEPLMLTGLPEGDRFALRVAPAATIKWSNTTVVSSDKNTFLSLGCMSSTSASKVVRLAWCLNKLRVGAAIAGAANPAVATW